MRFALAALALVSPAALMASWVPPGLLSKPEALRIYSNGLGFVEAVRFNSRRAVECGLRKPFFKDAAPSIARAQLVQDGLWIKAGGQLTGSEKAVAKAGARATIARAYLMPCRDLAAMPLLGFYDRAIVHAGDIPMPDLTR